MLYFSNVVAHLHRMLIGACDPMVVLAIRWCCLQSDGVPDSRLFLPPPASPFSPFRYSSYNAKGRIRSIDLASTLAGAAKLVTVVKDTVGVDDMSTMPASCLPSPASSTTSLATTTTPPPSALPSCPPQVHPCSDLSSWCCNLEVFRCVCVQDATQQTIESMCAATPNHGIDCDSCPSSPRCKAASTA